MTHTERKCSKLKKKKKKRGVTAENEAAASYITIASSSVTYSVFEGQKRSSLRRGKSTHIAAADAATASRQLAAAATVGY